MPPSEKPRSSPEPTNEDPPVTVGAAMVPMRPGEKEQNCAASETLVRQFASLGADLIVLPEVSLQGYPVGSLPRQTVLSLAEPVDGTYVKRYRTLAKEAGIHLIATYDMIRDGKLFNSAELIGPDGDTIGVYDKTHVLSGKEPGVYAAGDDLPVFDTAIGKIGILICNDRTYPETSRVLMLEGAELIAIPANGGFGEYNTTRLRTYAHDNGVHIVFSHSQQTLIIAPSGEVLTGAEGQAPGCLKTINLADRKQWREAHKSRRQPQLYRCLVEPTPTCR